MPAITFRPPHLTDVAHVALHMRAADVAEMHALGRYDMQALLQQSVRDSTFSHAVLIDGEAACLCGVAPLHGALLAETGVPWLLGTDAVPRHARSLMRRVPAYIARMLQAHPRLLNYVHADNRVAVGWLRRMGFALDPVAPFGPHGAPFHRFEMSR